MNILQSARARASVVCLMALALAAFWISRMSGAPVTGDAGGTLAMAINLVHHGVMSRELDQEIRPSMYREPIPVVTGAAMVALVDGFKGQAPSQEYFSGERAKFIKYQNVFWLGLLCVGVFLGARLFQLSFWAALATALVAQLVFFVYPGMRVIGADTLYSEIPAAALLALGTCLLTSGLTRASMLASVSAGVCMGLLALTKAAVLYILIGTLPLLVLLLGLTHRGVGHRGWLRSVAVFSLCFGVVVLPWMFRNQVLFDRFEISERGGLAVATRALKNEMTATEYMGSFYVWAPRPIRPAIGKLLGFGPDDMQKGGRLQRLNRDESDFSVEDLMAERNASPESAISFYRKGRAERALLHRNLARAGNPSPEATTDRQLAQLGIERILHRLPKHVLVTIPLLWRGAIFTLPIFIAALVCAGLRRRYDLAMFVLPALAYVMFHALVTPFEVRYGTVVYPVAIVALFALFRVLRVRNTASTPVSV